ncbi:MAG: TRIC cation channel family protein, partial [Geobacteraceae bacterium]|nr:TRIC cation channel family protein [Geobacteraceae bacterium]
FIGSILMGVMTATFGGMIRDVLSNEIPLILQREIYASACVAGGAALYLMHQAGLPEPLSLTTAALLVIAVRFTAILRGWQLPRRTDI